MKWSILSAILMSAFFVLPVQAQQFVGTCETLHKTEAMEVMDPDNFDAKLFDHAMRVETNYHRCLQGQDAVMPSTELAIASIKHADWMNANKMLEHQSDIAGEATPAERAYAQGISGYVGENIGWIAIYDFPDSGFRVLDEAQCRFEDTMARKIKPRTYAQFAKTSLDMLMTSTMHRENIINPVFGRVGHGAVFDDAAENCGKFYFAQTFSE